MIVVLMGVSGSGKTTVGELLAARLGWPFYDGDDFHPPANIEKMSRGIPLTDEDREGWLAALTRLIRDQLSRDVSGIVACSALKQAYRDRLCVDPAQVNFIYLKGDYDLILARMHTRQGHYMKAEMLASQFAALEEPRRVLTLDAARPPEKIVDLIISSILQGQEKDGLTQRNGSGNR